MKEAGISSTDIMCMTGHKNVASLQSYAAGSKGQQRANMSHILSSYSKKKSSSSAVVAIDASQNCMALDTGIKTSIEASLVVDKVETKHNLQNITSSIFAGVHFSGQVIINVQVNQK